MSMTIAPPWTGWPAPRRGRRLMLMPTREATGDLAVSVGHVPVPHALQVWDVKAGFT